MADPAPRDHRSSRATDDRGDASVLPFPSHPVRRDRPAETGPAEAPRLSTLLGDVLRQERHAQERTLAEVAEAAAVSLPYLSEVERGVKEVSSDLLAAICDALDLPLVEVLDRSVRRLRRTSARVPGPRAGGGSGTFALAA